MLRSKNCYVTYHVVNKKTREKTKIKLSAYLTPKQIRLAGSKPDVIWQFSQYLKNEFEKKGQTIEVYVNANVSVNGKNSKALIDPKVDMASVKWNVFSHNEWILPSK
jgi:hypothetical protein